MHSHKITDAAAYAKRDHSCPMGSDLESVIVSDLTDEEKIDIVAARILNRFRPAFEELAK